MEKSKIKADLIKIFVLKKLSTRELCVAAMLLAITAVLAIFCTFRIGNTIKIPLKFISVFISGALFGPWVAGVTAAAGDILNVVLAPSGAWLPQLTAVEFLCGFIYGTLFFRRSTSSVSYIIRTLICVILMFLIDMLLTSAILVSAGFFPSFPVAVGVRLTAGIVKAALQAVVMLAGTKYLGFLIKEGMKKGKHNSVNQEC